MSTKSPLLELENVSKDFGNVKALQNVSTKVVAGQVTCVLGDNGAGKSTFIKIISGLHKPSGGKYKFEGHEVAFESPREARALGIATVYQDLAMAPLMSVWRNFFLGSEPVRRFGPINLLDTKFARKTAKEEMAKLGIDVRDIDQPVGTLSGGERQSVAIARAVYFGARVYFGRTNFGTGCASIRLGVGLCKSCGRARSRRDFDYTQPATRFACWRSLLDSQSRPISGSV